MPTVDEQTLANITKRGLTLSVAETTVGGLISAHHRPSRRFAHLR